MSFEVELGDAAPTIPTINTPTSETLQKAAQDAIAKQIVRADAAENKGSPLLLYGVLGAACFGYWYANRKTRSY